MTISPFLGDFVCSFERCRGGSNTGEYFSVLAFLSVKCI